MNTEATEREKYRKIWARPEYNLRSPGLRHAPEALEWFHEHECRNLTDYGCGSGKALFWFLEQGVSACGIDIAPPVAHPRIIEGCLWNCEMPETDFAFSSDVLEHLPPEHVDTVLARIREHTRVAGWLKVATKPDRMGHLIGETLHLTVRSRAWWVDKIGEFFDVVDHHIEGAGYVLRVRI